MLVGLTSFPSFPMSERETTIVYRAERSRSVLSIGFNDDGAEALDKAPMAWRLCAACAVLNQAARSDVARLVSCSRLQVLYERS